MLSQFSVKNFRSFKDEITLDLQATNITEHEDNTIVNSKNGEKHLPLAVIYGPNGSGKSNIIGAIYGLVSKVMRPICTICDNKDCSKLKDKFTISPFKFNEQSLKEPTSFEVYFTSKKGEYRYNLAIQKEKIIYESLYRKTLEKNNISKVFIRDNQKNIDINKTILKNINTSGITETLPLLSFLGITYKKLDIVTDIFSWFENQIEIINYPYNESSIRFPINQKFNDLFLNMIKEMDIDIEGYRIENEEKEKTKIYTKHIINDIEKELELHEESNGIIKLFGLLPNVTRSILEGTTLIIDELDSKLHPKLIEYIIELYRNKSKNKKNAQLIFTSHDLMTMNADLFRRDEIWFVAKTPDQSSQLYSLVEFKKTNGKKPRKDEKYGKQYIEGRYGAVPYIKHMINWEKLDGSNESK